MTPVACGRDWQLRRPAAALAELIGIILIDGVRLPTARIERIHLAEVSFVVQLPDLG